MRSSSITGLFIVVNSLGAAMRFACVIEFTQLEITSYQDVEIADSHGQAALTAGAAKSNGYQ